MPHSITCFNKILILAIPQYHWISTGVFGEFAMLPDV